MKYSTKPNRSETIWGIAYLLLYMAVLPRLIPLALHVSGLKLTQAQGNFLFFAVDLAATAVIFRRFLAGSFRDALRAPGANLWAAILGYLGNRVLSILIGILILKVEPEFANVNDMAIDALCEDGSVKIPEALRPYMGGKTEIVAINK